MRFPDDNDASARRRSSLLATAWGLRTAGTVVSAMILLGGWSGFHYLSHQRQTLLDQCRSTTALLRNAATLEARSAHLQLQLRAATVRRDRAVSRIPDSADETEFLRQLATIARQTRLEIRDYRPGRVSQWPTHSEVELAIRAEASYESLCRFLDALGDLPRICRVSQMTITAPSDPAQPSVIDFHIALTFGLHPLRLASR